MAKKKVIEPTKITVVDGIDQGKSEIESLKEEMENWRDNMEEKLSQTPKYDEVSEVCDTLDNIISSLDGMNELNSDVACEEMTLTFSGKKRPSRNDRMSEAIMLLEEAKSFIETRVETLDNGITLVEDKEGETECAECDEDAFDSTEDLVKHMKDAHNQPDQIIVYDSVNDEAVWVGKAEPDTDATLLTKDTMVEEKENLEYCVQQLDEAIDEANGVSFLGMY